MPRRSAAVVCALRLWRWKVWKLRDPAVLFLHFGFFWLAAGFFMVAVQPLLSSHGSVEILHIITVGALGTFTLSVMTRVTLQKSRHAMVFPALVEIALGSIALAAVLRVLTAIRGQDVLLMVLAGAFWFLAWALFLIFLLRFIFDADKKTC